MDVPTSIFESWDIHFVQFRAQYEVKSRNCTEWMSRFILEETDDNEGRAILQNLLSSQ